MKLKVQSNLVSGLAVIPEPYATLAGSERAIHYKAMQILAVYKDDVSITRDAEFTYYNNVPNTAEVSVDDLNIIYALGGDVEEYPAMLVVTDRNAELTGFTKSVESGELDAEGNKIYVEAPMLYRDLETFTQKFKTIDGVDYIGTQTLYNGVRYAKASELISNGLTFIRNSDYKDLLPTTEEI